MYRSLLPCPLRICSNYTLLTLYFLTIQLPHYFRSALHWNHHVSFAYASSIRRDRLTLFTIVVLDTIDKTSFHNQDLRYPSLSISESLRYHEVHSAEVAQPELHFRFSFSPAVHSRQSTLDSALSIGPGTFRMLLINEESSCSRFWDNRGGNAKSGCWADCVWNK